MNKTMEYMSYGLPSVSFDLKETRVSAGDSAVYVPDGDLEKYTDAIEELLDDSDLRVHMGLRARELVTRQLDWRSQAVTYVATFDSVAGETRDVDVDLAPAGASTDPHEFVADTPQELAHFLRERNRPERRVHAGS